MLLPSRRWMDPIIITSLVFLISVLLPSVLSSDMSLLANRLTGADGDDRIDVWHSNCFSRCGHQQLQRTLDVACNYDPYRLRSRYARGTKTSKRKRDTIDHSILFNAMSERDPNIFLTKRLASSFLHHGSTKRAVLSRKKRGIVEECCYNVCAWEEYGEYCHGYMRTTKRKATMCL